MAPWTTRLAHQAEVSRTFGDWLNHVVGFHQVRFFSTVATLPFQNELPGRAGASASSAILNNINRLGNYEVPPKRTRFGAFRFAPI